MMEVARIASLSQFATQIVQALGDDATIVTRTHECSKAGSVSPSVCTSPLWFDEQGIISQRDRLVAEKSCQALIRESYFARHSSLFLQFYMSKHWVDLSELLKSQPDIILSHCRSFEPGLSQAEHQKLLDELFGRPVYFLDTAFQTIEEWMECTRKISHVLRKDKIGEELINTWRRQLDCVASLASGRRQKNVACLISIHPCAAVDSYISGIVRHAGGVDICASECREEECFTMSELMEKEPEIVIIYMEGFNLQEVKHQLQCCSHMLKGLNIWKVDIAVLDAKTICSSIEGRIVRLAEVMLEIMHSEAQPFGHHGSLWEWLHTSTGNRQYTSG